MGNGPVVGPPSLRENRSLGQEFLGGSDGSFNGGGGVIVGNP